jgi:hypothetical protein
VFVRYAHSAKHREVNNGIPVSAQFHQHLIGGGIPHDGVKIEASAHNHVRGRSVHHLTNARLIPGELSLRE